MSTKPTFGVIMCLTYLLDSIEIFLWWTGSWLVLVDLLVMSTPGGTFWFGICFNSPSCQSRVSSYHVAYKNLRTAPWYYIYRPLFKTYKYWPLIWTANYFQFWGNTLILKLFHGAWHPIESDSEGSQTSLNLNLRGSQTLSESDSEGVSNPTQSEGVSDPAESDSERISDSVKFGS